MTRKISFDVPEQTFLDVLTTAVEQGIAYWANAYNGGKGNEVRRGAEGCVIYVKLGETIDEDEYPYKPVGRISAETLATAVSTYGQQYPHLVQALISGDVDAPTADALFQLAAFGDVVYG